MIKFRPCKQDVPKKIETRRRVTLTMLLAQVIKLRKKLKLC